MSSTERLANEIDLALFNLAQRTGRLANDSRVKDESDRWQEITLLLFKARHHARAMMSQHDTERTRG